MVDINVVYDKLCGFETADELAAFLASQGVKGEPQDATGCAITRFVMMQTGFDTVSTNTESLLLYGPDGEGLVFNKPHTDAVADFIQGFDHGRYPDLVEPKVEWWGEE